MTQSSDRTAGAVVKVIEVVGSSPNSFSDAVRNAVKGSTPTAAEKIALELPGEVIQRGTYTLKWGQFDAGTEEYLITKSDDGCPDQGMSQPAA